MAKFRVRARTVDMLGRQQIAGIPTAISELFKNAHDAYATHVEVDYFRQDDLFVLRDDGLGMTREDFEQRWLTLGTESKLKSKTGISKPPRDMEQKERPVLGEKGIGRLAIAAIGPLVLVLSRAKRKNETHNLIAALIHWGLFEFPGVDLDQIEIPVEEVKDGKILNKKTLQGMIEKIRSQLEAPLFKKEIELVLRIRDDLKKFNIDPEELYGELGEPSLGKREHGTHFLIMPSDETLPDLIDGKDEDKLPGIQKMLLGFSNTMTPGHKKPPIITEFRDYKKGGMSSDEVIGEKLFFTPAEFREADHYFKGSFDEYGNFSGAVSIYGQKEEKYNLEWRSGRKIKTECGPFDLNFAYVQGTQNDSRLPPEEYARIGEKLKKMGGLYVYRNGVRVLPYGDSNFDFLDIEVRRSKHAGNYFYSYRRMFGVIELTSDENSNLQEKAGREGFRENSAYREFRQILINFFLQTAMDFFREGKSKDDTYQKEKERINKNNEIRQQREKETKKARETLARELEDFFENANSGAFANKAQAILEKAEKEIKKLEMAFQKRKSVHDIWATLENLENQTRQDLEDLAEKILVKKPEGVGLPEELSDQWDDYEVEHERLQKKFITPTISKVNKLFTNFVKQHETSLKISDYFSKQLKKFTSPKRQAMEEAAKEIRTELNRFNSEILKEIQTRCDAVFQSIDGSLSKFEKLSFSSLNENSIADERHSAQEKIGQVYASEHEHLIQLSLQLKRLIKAASKQSYTQGELTEALEEELEVLKAQRDRDIELVQIGIAINVINHEFEKVIGSMRKSLDELNLWAKENDDLSPLYQRLRVGFEHLDSYLKMFTPFDRRLQRNASNISGKEIYTYLKELFDDRLRKSDIELSATSGFLSQDVKGYRSSVYPAFVNLLDNSIYWLERSKVKKPIIGLEKFRTGFLVTDNGPGISEKDEMRVFEFGFSRKPGGRGMGLYISRETLKKAGFSLDLHHDSRKGASFTIIPSKKEEA